MPIIYSLVTRGSCVLAEYTATSGNFTTVTRRILEKIPPQDAKMSYVYDRHIFHYIVDDGITYLCMADEEFGRRIPFAFLDDVKNRFRATYGDRGKTAIAYGMNTDFSRVLQNQMDFYSNNPGADRINRVRGEIDEVKSVMVHNIEKVLERGERIELLVDKTESLNQNAFKFKKASTQLKRAMWWKNIKIMIILIFVVAVVVYFIVAMACGGMLFQNCRKTAEKILHTTTSSSTTTAASTSAATATATTSTSDSSTSAGDSSTTSVAAAGAYVRSLGLTEPVSVVKPSVTRPVAPEMRKLRGKVPLRGGRRL
jgi:vesicle-associated membrane protein 7